MGPAVADDRNLEHKLWIFHQTQLISCFKCKKAADGDKHCWFLTCNPPIFLDPASENLAENRMQTPSRHFKPNDASFGLKCLDVSNACWGAGVTALEPFHNEKPVWPRWRLWPRWRKALGKHGGEAPPTRWRAVFGTTLGQFVSSWLRTL